MISVIAKLIPMFVLVAAMGGSSEELNRVGDQLIDLVQEFRARYEMSELIKIIRLDLLDNQPIPKDIVKYARDNLDSQGGDVGKDPWGTEWRTKGSSSSPPFFLISCGPDKNCGRRKDNIEVQVIDKTGRPRSRVK